MPIKKLIKIDKIIPNEKNPRLIKVDEYERLKESIREFPEMMELKPIVVNKDMMIIGGHQRYKAYKELNIQDVWIIVADNLTPEQEQEFMLKDNKNNGVWDYDLLALDFTDDVLIKYGIKEKDGEAVHLDFEEITTKGNALYPIVERFDENYRAVIIIVKNETNLTFIKDKLQLGRMKENKKDGFGQSYVISDENFIKLYE